jgi:hypothetical protein
MMEHLNNIYHKKETTGVHYSLPNHQHRFHYPGNWESVTKHCQLQTVKGRVLDKTLRNQGAFRFK